jgi:hypothetical protein
MRYYEFYEDYYDREHEEARRKAWRKGNRFPEGVIHVFELCAKKQSDFVAWQVEFLMWQSAGGLGAG